MKVKLHFWLYSNLFFFELSSKYLLYILIISLFFNQYESIELRFQLQIRNQNLRRRQLTVRDETQELISSKMVYIQLLACVLVPLYMAIKLHTG